MKINKNFWFYDTILLFNLIDGFLNYFLNSILKDKMILDSQRKIIVPKSHFFNSVSTDNFSPHGYVQETNTSFYPLWQNLRVSLNIHERVGSFDEARVRKGA